MLVLELKNNKKKGIKREFLKSVCCRGMHVPSHVGEHQAVGLGMLLDHFSQGCGGKGIGMERFILNKPT